MPWLSVESVVESHGLEAGRWENWLFRKWGPYSEWGSRPERSGDYEVTQDVELTGHLSEYSRLAWYTAEPYEAEVRMDWRSLRWKCKRAKKYIKLFLSPFWSGPSCYPGLPGTLCLWASANLPLSGNAAGMESLQALSCEPLKGRDFILCITVSQPLALRLSHSWCSISICLFCTFI